MEGYESVLVVKQEVFVYKIPPRTTNRGYRAADWNLQTPDWTGRMRLVSKGNECIMKLEDKTTGELFAKCPIDKYPGIAVEAVSDSSRYFVLRIQDDNGRTAFIGFGFADRGDSFDLNVALQDHFKWVEKTEKFQEEEKQENKPQLDLSFKEGQTITINIGQKSGTSRPKSKGSAAGIMLPPPPGSGMKIAPPPTGRNVSPSDPGPKAAQSNSVEVSPTASQSATGTSNLDLLLDLGGAVPGAGANQNPTEFPINSQTTDLWNEFATAGATNTAAAAAPIPTSHPQNENSGGSNWVQF